MPKIPLDDHLHCGVDTTNAAIEMLELLKHACVQVAEADDTETPVDAIVVLTLAGSESTMRCLARGGADGQQVIEGLVANAAYRFLKASAEERERRGDADPTHASPLWRQH